MKTIICSRPHELAGQERPVPERRPGEVLLRIRRVGVCGTDYHIFQGNQPYLAYPRVMGHELAGTIEAADADSPLSLGQTATVLPYLSCGTCVACRRGKTNCCVRINVLGVHIDGGMAEYVSVPESAVIPVEGLSLDHAAMVEFLAIGAHAVRRADTRTGDRVLVVGAGPIGVAVALFAQIEGAQVTIVDRSEGRLAAARERAGLAGAVLADDGLQSRLADATDGEFFDTVFDATGNPAAMEAGFAYVAHGGKYVLVSIVSADIRFSDPEFHKRETTLMGSRNATHDDFRYVIDHIRAGHLPMDKLHSHSFDLSDAPRLFPELIADQGNVMKAIGAI
ncbi:zinc-binding alcohol dehydrogenase family protein [Sphingobium sp. CR28]|uniref:zinc-binding alcohol dehydrogenase family protein n=1 Tax=Sphingobium sp. CR28 TaxID=3400272 RepID=UPI003FEFBE49